MRVNNEWKDYKLIATGDGMKLESFGSVVLLRPDPQIIWEAPFDLYKYKGIHAIYERSSDGGGKWKVLRKVPDSFFVNWRGLKFDLKLMNFKHTGVFPEQAVNWDKSISVIKDANRQINILNLFAYTGGATLACASAGAKVCHVDAAKAMCDKAKTNVTISGIDTKNTRFIIDDCAKFVEREIRRGNKYDAVIMDPPSYGRGPKGELWKLEDNIFELVKLTKGVVSENPLFYLINSYTTGLQPTVIKNIMDINFKEYHAETDADEIGLKGEDGIVLPCGCSGFLTFNKEQK